jgi:hypothetical protein
MSVWFEDCELPDLVLEIIIGFVAQVTPMECWGELCSVSRRWCRLARPVLREVFLRMWPKYSILRTRPEGDLSFSVRISASRNLAQRSGSSNYQFAMVEPLPLAPIVAGGRPVGVRFVPSSSGGVYVGLFIVHGRSSALLHTRIQWDPDNSKDKLPDSSEPLCCVFLGCYSGEKIRHHVDGEKIGDSSAGVLETRENEPYEVVYHPGSKGLGGSVSFQVNGRSHGLSPVDDLDMLSRCGADALVVFAVAMDSNQQTLLQALGDASTVKLADLKLAGSEPADIDDLVRQV